MAAFPLLPDHGEQKLLPQAILDMNYAFARTAMLMAAVRLHLFTSLAERAQAADALAARTGMRPAAAQRLLRGLQTLGLVAQEDGVYRLTPLANHFLVEGKPSYLGGDTLAMTDYVPAWLELDQTLCTSVPYRDLGDASTAEAFFAPRVLDLFPLIFPVARRAASELVLDWPAETPLHLLDLGAGSAPWSAAFAQVYPAAHVTALDLPAVAARGRQKIAELGLEDRYTWIEADMERVALPPVAYDLIFCGHICRFLSDERAQMLLRRLAQSLRPGGSLLVADIFLADDLAGPPAAITLDLSMLVNTAGGRIRTVSELTAWLHKSELAEVVRLDGVGPFPLVVARKEGRL
ncbi:MAG TPA: class I SAM-dependent methyltransferase [Ktedonobacteraceae bacterium]|jgi:ubiquinone/menaquinone biosynthesis C-methylase UbiE